MAIFSLSRKSQDPRGPPAALSSAARAPPGPAVGLLGPQKGARGPPEAAVSVTCEFLSCRGPASRRICWRGSQPAGGGSALRAAEKPLESSGGPSCSSRGLKGRQQRAWGPRETKCCRGDDRPTRGAGAGERAAGFLRLFQCHLKQKQQ